MPLTMADHVWVKHEPNVKPSERMTRRSDARDDDPMFLVRSLKKLEQTRIDQYYLRVFGWRQQLTPAGVVGRMLACSGE
jgi:hypothetical protein